MAEGPAHALLSGHAGRSSHVFDTTLSSISDFAYVFDRQGRFLYANKALLDLWKSNLAEVIGKNFFDLKYPAELASRLQRQIEQVFQSGQRVTDETVYVSPTGVAGYYEYIFSPVFSSKGEVEFVAGLTRNITDRKRTETLVEAQRKSLEQVVSGKPLGEILTFLTRIVEEESEHRTIAAILLLDEKGRLRIGAAPSLPEYFNQAIDGLVARADLGTCSVAAVTAKVVITPDFEADPKWADIKHLPLGLGLKGAWSRPIVARSGKVLGTFGTYFRECREPTSLEQQIVEILSHTAALAIERSLADEERERLLASERQARADADAANLSKDRFIAVLSHELRTPLSPVMMAVPAIELDSELPGKFRDDLAMIRRNIELEVKLIDDLLDVSRVSSGKLRLQMSTIHVHEVLRHAIDNGVSDPSEKRIVIKEDFRAGDDRLTADPARLQQVFWNLIRNAAKFTPRDGGEATVRTWNDAGNGQLVIEVEDNGVGIPAEVLPRIFNAFEQGDARISHHFGGLGLGLAIAKAVVEMHGGTISAASDGLGRGAKFTIRFVRATPGKSEQPIPRGIPREKRVSAKRAKILLVEDHRDTARMMTRLLERSGYEVKQAENASSALQLADGEAFDLVVSDIGLPDMTGYELMRQLKGQYGLKGIALTGYGMEDDLRQSRDAGFLEHVVKPVNMTHLETAIDRISNVKSGEMPQVRPA